MITRKFLSKLIPALPMLLAAALVILVTVIFLTAMRSKAHAQFSIVEQPMFQLTSTSVPFSPEQIPGLAYYWTATDFTNMDIGRMNSWTDHIQGFVFTNSEGKGPSNLANGLFFYGASDSRCCFTNVYLDPISGNDHLSLVFTFQTSDFSQHIQTLIDKRSVSRSSVAWYNNEGADIYAGGDRLWIGAAGIGGNGVGGKIPFSTDYQTAIVVSNHLATSVTYIYTNGVLLGSWAAGIIAGFDSVGRSAPDGWPWRGYINEFMIFTNTVLTQNQISNLNTVAFKPFPHATPNANPLLSQYDVDALGLNDGDLISSLTDGGPYGYALGQSDDRRPYWTNNPSVINGEGYAFFDGSNDYMTNLFTSSYTNPTHIFMVMNVDDDAGANVWFDGRPTKAQFAYEQNNDGVIHLGNGVVELTSTVGAAQINGWKVWEFYFDHDLAFVKTNNVTAMAGDFSAGDRSGITIGTDRSFTYPTRMDVAWMAFYTNTLSSASNLVWTLGDRYGITTYTRN